MSFFSSRLDHIGCKALANLQADKETNAPKTRQFLSIVTVNPKSPKLTYIYLGQPSVKGHHELNSWDIQRDQLEGGSFDKQYFHLSVSPNLTNVVCVVFICMRNPFYKGGVVK